MWIYWPWSVISFRRVPAIVRGIGEGEEGADKGVPGRRGAPRPNFGWALGGVIITLEVGEGLSAMGGWSANATRGRGRWKASTSSDELVACISGLLGGVAGGESGRMWKGTLVTWNADGIRLFRFSALLFCKTHTSGRQPVRASWPRGSVASCLYAI